MKKKEKELVLNRKAYHDYEILEKFEAGIALQGTEVKSLRNHGGSLRDAYITVKKGELWLINCHIAPYRYGTANGHEEKRERKLLMHKKEVVKLKRLLQEKGYTLIPLSFYLKKGIIKVKIACAKGKKVYEKRAKIKEKEDKKAIERTLKQQKY